jgi:hypothetical protein
MTAPSKDDQHPGVGCCLSCIQDEEFDASYSMWPSCCCRSQLTSEELDDIESEWNRTK